MDKTATEAVLHLVAHGMEKEAAIGNILNTQFARKALNFMRKTQPFHRPLLSSRQDLNRAVQAYKNSPSRTTEAGLDLMKKFKRVQELQDKRNEHFYKILHSRDEKINKFWDFFFPKYVRGDYYKSRLDPVFSEGADEFNKVIGNPTSTAVGDYVSKWILKKPTIGGIVNTQLARKVLKDMGPDSDTIKYKKALRSLFGKGNLPDKSPEDLRRFYNNATNLLNAKGLRQIDFESRMLKASPSSINTKKRIAPPMLKDLSELHSILDNIM